MITRAMSLERLEQLKKAEPAVYAAIEEMYQKREYTERERQLIEKLRELGNWQLEAACSWFEFDLMRGPHDVNYLEGVIQQWDKLSPTERPAISREAVEDRLLNLKNEIANKEAEAKDAQKHGYFWSIVPLLEYFTLPEDERAGTSFYPLLPFFMQEAYERIQNPRPQKPGAIARWVGNIKRLRLRVTVFGTGGEAEIERHKPDDTHQE